MRYWQLKTAILLNDSAIIYSLGLFRSEDPTRMWRLLSAVANMSIKYAHCDCEMSQPSRSYFRAITVPDAFKFNHENWESSYDDLPK